jgi:hypothetical protein
MEEGDRPGGGPEATGRRLTVAEAAEVLGITAEAVRSRIKRRTLHTIREGGTVYVVLSEATAGEATDRAQPVGDRARPGVDSPIDRTDALIDALSGQVEDLREQLHSERQAHAEARRLLMAALERIPPQLEAPQEARGSPETVEEERQRAEPRPDAPGAQEGVQRPWWRRIIGG